MMFYIKVEDSNGVIKSYLRFNDENTSCKVYQLLVEECLQKGDSVKLMDENFQILTYFQSNRTDIVESSKDSYSK